MRATTLLNRVLNLDGANVTGVTITDETIAITIRLRSCRLRCPHCEHSTAHRYDTRTAKSSWRHLDLGGQICTISTRRRRLRCPTHGVIAEHVPFARPASGFTRDFEDLAVWLATK